MGGGFFKRREQKSLGKNTVGVNPFTRCVHWELRGKEEVTKARVKKVEGVNLEVLTFGFKGKEPMSKAGEEEEGGGEGEGEGAGGTRGVRVTSALFWDKGPMTSDASFAAVEIVAKQKEQSAAESLVWKREAAEKELQRSAKYAKLAEAAQQKLAQTGQDVKQAKLLKEELVGVLRGMGETPASSARKEVLEGALQELLGQPTTVPTATAEEEAAATGATTVEPTTAAMPAATSAAN
ncbi:hypothetical protein CYMTET_53538 [Cymbomonas tetramitiformis]|uniref:Uncharacterized protein n=1 Tax=Cymbomonas tetramitiformis TaxID=36881 RepID=A0AAE0BH07_9CHLO|nr:hypothetical protein CYMTET_53538 [Cymbomonas tetramitiformis]